MVSAQAENSFDQAFHVAANSGIRNSAQIEGNLHYSEEIEALPQSDVTEWYL